MQISLTAKDVHELFEEWRDIGHQPRSTGINEQTIQFPAKICDGWMQRSQIRPGIDMGVQNVHCKEAFSLGIEEKGNIALLRIGFCLTGQAQGFVDSNHQELEFQAGHFGIGFAEEAGTGSIEFAQGQTNILSAYIDPTMLSSLMGYQPDCLPRAVQNILEGKVVPFYFQAGRMNPAMNLSAQQILRCPYQGFTKQLYLESKLLELLALSLHETTADN